MRGWLRSPKFASSMVVILLAAYITGQETVRIDQLQGLLKQSIESNDIIHFERELKLVKDINMPFADGTSIITLVIRNSGARLDQFTKSLLDIRGKDLNQTQIDEILQVNYALGKDGMLVRRVLRLRSKKLTLSSFQQAVRVCAANRVGGTSIVTELAKATPTGARWLRSSSSDALHYACMYGNGSLVSNLIYNQHPLSNKLNIEAPGLSDTGQKLENVSPIEMTCLVMHDAPRESLAILKLLRYKLGKTISPLERSRMIRLIDGRIKSYSFASPQWIKDINELRMLVEQLDIKRQVTSVHSLNGRN